MAVIWGLDLGEIQWSKFKNSNMWNSEYHRRRTKFIVYQCAMILMIVSESLGTAALSSYNKQRSWVYAHTNPHAHIHTRNFAGVASFNIFVGIYVATIFGSGFFFDLFWPERTESRAVKLAWRICSVLACVFTLASALVFTYIVAAKSAYVDGGEARPAIAEHGGNSPLRYRDNVRAITSVCFLWPGVVATVASTILLWHCLSHIDKFGPKSKYSRANYTATGSDGHVEKSIDSPSPSIVAPKPQTDGQTDGPERNGLQTNELQTNTTQTNGLQANAPLTNGPQAEKSETVQRPGTPGSLEMALGGNGPDRGLMRAAAAANKSYESVEGR